MSSNMKKWLSLITSFAVAFVMCLGCMGMFADKAYADVGDSDLEVYYNGALIGEFYYCNEGDHNGELYYYTEDSSEPVYIENKGPYNYSAFNNKANSDNALELNGPKVLDIIDATGIDRSDFGTQMITFFPGDDYPEIAFLWSNLFDPNRSYFPNARNAEAGDEGVAVEPSELVNAEPVPVIIESYLIKKKVLNGQLSYGQLSPSERTKANWQKHMIKIDSKVPRIEIEDQESVDKAINNSVGHATANGEAIPDNGKIAIGSEIQFGDNSGEEFTYTDDVVLYYTTDGKEPDMNSAIYNWYKQSGDNEYKFAKIKADKVGPLTIKTKAYSFTTAPSDTAEFNYSVTADFVKDNATLTLGQTKCVVGVEPAVTVKIGADEIDAKYYTASYSNSKVGTGNVTVTGKDLCSGTLTGTFTVIPAKAAISKVKKGKKKVTVTIKSQKASGVTKYQIAYKKKTAKKWKTVTTKNTKKVIKKLKSKTKYNIKVRAYGPTGYGEYSAVKTVKVK